MKYHYLQCCFTYSMMQRPGGLAVVLVLALIFSERAAWETTSGGEFGWGGTSVKR